MAMRNEEWSEGGMGMVVGRRLNEKTTTDRVFNRERVRHARAGFSHTGMGRGGHKCFN